MQRRTSTSFTLPAGLLAGALSVVILAGMPGCSSGDRAHRSPTHRPAPQRTTTTATSGSPTSSQPSSTAAPTTAPPAATTWYRPSATTRWQWVLNGKVDLANADQFDMYDVDLQSMVPGPTEQVVTWANGFTATVTWPRGDDNPGAIEQLHAAGKKVICYIDTGAFEDYRPDASLFPGTWGNGDRSASEDSGGRDRWGRIVPYEGPPQYAGRDVVGGDSSDSSGDDFSGEYWLDQRESAWEVWAPIIWARLDLAKRLGCDGVEGDQNNAYGNDDTFGASEAVSLRLYREFYLQAHQRGLAAISKNGIELTAQMVDDPGTADLPQCTPGRCLPDGFLNEECHQYDECDALVPAEAKGFWIGQVEYEGDRRSICDGPSGAVAGHRMAMRKPETDPVDERITFACWRP